MDLLIMFSSPLFLLLLGFFIGIRLESNHYKSIRDRELAMRDLVAINFSRLPFDIEVEKAEMVTGSVVVSLDYFKRFLAQLRAVVGGRIKSYEPLLDRARREAVLRMKEQALASGHNRVVNMRQETIRLANSRGGGKRTAGVEVLAYGTALSVLEKF